MNWWHYLLLVNIYLSLFFAFYSLLLRRETFFQLNRIYLVGTAILSFFIPLIQSDWVKDMFITQQVQYTLYGTNVGIIDIAPIKDNPLTVGQVLLILYTAGVIILVARLMLQLILLRQIIKDPAPSASYSFFNKIKVKDGIDGKDVIESHELVHARQFHSADVLIIEAVMIINWFNPVVYLYRFAIKHVHEYIADRHTLKAGTNKAEYAMLLLSQTFNMPAHQLVNPFFNHSLLKKRIMMLQKDKSARLKLVKYGLSAPLFILMLVLSSATISNSKAVDAIHNKAEAVFSSPAKDVLIEEPEVAKSIVDAGSFSALQADTVPKKGDAKYVVNMAPSFPGGQQAFSRFLAQNIKYPADAKSKNIQGRSIISFTVEEDGSLTDMKVVRAIGGGADEEAMRVLRMSPKWKPGTSNGRPVRTEYNVPVNFSLEGKSLAAVKSQQELDSNPVFTAVENVPTFPGGDEAFGKFLAANVKYPKAAREANLQGRVVATFIIEKDGSLSNVKIIRGVGMGIDEEALRVLKLSPNWNPGVQNGHKVRVSYSVPVSFALAPEAEVKTGYVPDKALDDTTISASSIKYKNSYKAKPLYVLNGKIMKPADMQTLNPNDIESMSVLKSDKATKAYGRAGANGVVEIYTKKKIKL